MKLHLIAAALPPQLDGIGDYSALLAAEMAHSVEVTILTGGGPNAAPIPGVRILPAFSAAEPGSVGGIAAVARRENPDWLLLQYNPFSYGKRGLNLQLPLMLRRLRRDLPTTRLAIMIHEPFVPVIDWKFAIMTTWQRAQLLILGRNSQCVFASQEIWAQKFARWFPGKPIVHLPVGSNIPRIAIGREEARGRLGIGPQTLVLGLFGTAHPSRLLPLMRQVGERLRSTGRDILMLYIGPDAAVVREALGDLPLLTDRPLPPDEVSRRFAAMDIHLAAFIDGVSTRRGSFMAGIQHGIATVGTHGAFTDSRLGERAGEAFLLAPVASPELYLEHTLQLSRDPELRSRIGVAGRRLYDAEFDWPPIAARLLTTLQRAAR